jgi:hypothetical protein
MQMRRLQSDEATEQVQGLDAVLFLNEEVIKGDE